MNTYKSKSGKPAGVIGFEIRDKSITVQFNNLDIYDYTYESSGEDVVEEMKALALGQMGLSTFISQNDPSYHRKR